MSDERRCENCQTEVTADATFCPKCGQKLEAPVMSSAPPPMPPAAVAAPPPRIPPPPHVAPAPQPKRRSPWPAVIIGCGVLVLLVVAGVGYAGYRGYQAAKAEMVKLQAETKSAPSTDTSTASGASGAATDDEPVIEVSEDPTNNPPQAYAVEDVPPLEVQEGQPAGPVTSGDRAAGLVLTIADVQAWVALVDEARAQGKKRQALVTVELIPDSGNYRVHLFENVEDEEPGHIATFGWFRVDKATGAVTNETMDSD